MNNILGKRINDLREKLGLTQDQFGAKYGVSGPAIFKFEKNYVKPSLELWLKIAHDCGISERHAVLLWVKAKLPNEYHDFIEIDGEGEMSVREQSEKYGVLDDIPEYAQITDRKVLRQVLQQDQSLPSALRELIADDDFWIVFKPTGAEIYGVAQKFGMFPNAPRDYFSEALRLMRNFLSSDVI